jgi:hypothetical protein
MAIVLTGPVVGTFDPSVTDGAGGFNLQALANNNHQPAINAVGLRPFTFLAFGQSIGNESITLALLAPIDLTARGVTFPAGSMRNIRTRVWSRRAAVANAGFVEKITTVIGGAIPSVAPASGVPAAVAALYEPSVVAATPNNNSAAAPEYGTGLVLLDPVSTANVIVGVQNLLGTTRAATSATLLRWRLEVLVEPLVTLPVAA